MRTLLFSMAASLAVAAPAMADTRVEARGGLVSIGGTEEPVLGVAGGIDFSIAPFVFAGAEVSSDKVDAGGGKTALGFSGRLGASLPSGTKLYGVGGYSTALCNLCEDRWHAGAGVQQSVAGPVYLKAEYRRYLPTDTAPGTSSFIAGVGVSF